jgi:predicted HicB family RNase H-like nuclease
MPRPPRKTKLPGLNIRDIPEEIFYRLKIAAAVERKSVRTLVLELIERRIQELEKKGLLPKGKG